MCFQSNLLDTTTTQILFFRNLPGYDDDDPKIPNLAFISDLHNSKATCPWRKSTKEKSYYWLSSYMVLLLWDCMKYILLAICAIDDAIIPFWKEEVLNQKCKQNCSTRFFTISWWNDVHDHVHASSEIILILSVKVALILPVIIPWHKQAEQEESIRIDEEGLYGMHFACNFHSWWCDNPLPERKRF